MPDLWVGLPPFGSQDVGFQRIYLPMWTKPWDRQRAEATFKGLSRYK